jgi:hypothetical protein
MTPSPIPIHSPARPKGAGELRKLLTAYGASQAAGHLLTTTLAATVLAEGHSAVLAALVLVINYLPSAFLTARLGPWIDRHGDRRRTLVAIEGTAAVLTVFSLLAAGGGLLVAMYVLLAVRAAAMAAARGGYARWLKQISPVEVQGRRMKLFTLTFLGAQTLAGLLAGAVLLGPQATLPGRLLVLDLGLYALAAGGVLLLCPLTEARGGAKLAAEPQGLSAMLGAIWATAALRESFTVVVLSQATFQAAALTLVTLLPAAVGLGPGGSGVCQAAMGVGFLVGFAVVFQRPGLFWSGRLSRPCPCLAAAGAGAAALLLAAASGVAAVAVAAFALMALAFELLFLEHQAGFFQASPRHVVGRYQHLLSALGGLCMSLTCLLHALLCELFGLAVGTAAFLALMGTATVGAVGALARGRAARGRCTAPAAWRDHSLTEVTP